MEPKKKKRGILLRAVIVLQLDHENPLFCLGLKLFLSDPFTPSWIFLSAHSHTVGRFRNGERVQLPSSSLASVESLTMPQEQVIVMSADLRCPDGRRRVSEVLSRMDEDIWSVLVDSREKTVILRCRSGGNARRKSISTGEKLQSLLIKNCKSW